MRYEAKCENMSQDITKHVLSDCESVGMLFIHVRSFEYFRHHVDESLCALDKKVNELETADEPGAVFLAYHINDLRKRVIEGHMLTLQSMWERGLREMLVSCENKLNNGLQCEYIEKAQWKGKSRKNGAYIQDHFQRLIGISLDSFSSYDDLHFLQTIGNAIRHGDGVAAKDIYDLSPSLWPFANGSSNTPRFNQIDIPLSALKQMIQSVIWFWIDIDNIRCNSFDNKADSIIQKLSGWRGDIARRASERIWSIC